MGDRCSRLDMGVGVIGALSGVDKPGYTVNIGYLYIIR